MYFCHVPMRVLIIGLGSAGDVHPNVGLAIALRDRGHDATLVAPCVFESVAQRAGVRFVGLGTEEEFYAAIHDPDLWDAWRSFQVVAKRLILPWMRPVYEIIAERRAGGPVTVAAPATSFGARVAQERLGVPLATVHLQPSMLRSLIAPSCYGFPDIIRLLPRFLLGSYMRWADRQIIDPPLAPELNAFREELGLLPIRRPFDAWMHSPDLVIGLFPDWYAPPPADWPPNLHLTSFPLYDESETRTPPPELMAFLDAGENPVVFTAGSAMTQAERFFHESVKACRAGGWRGVLLTQFPDQLPPDLPESIRHFDYAPFSAVLPRAKAFVHHGGIGTTAQALAAGVPQLVIPFAHDQPDNAVRVKRLGVGDFLLPGRYRARAATRKLEALLSSDEVHEQCRRRAAELRRFDGLAPACDLIEKL